jgi:hypothetical protein
VQLGELARDDDLTQRSTRNLEVGKRALESMWCLVHHDGATLGGDLRDDRGALLTRSGNETLEHES